VPPQAAAAIQNYNFRQPNLVKFIPELKSLEPISFSGHYDTVNDSIVLNAAIPKLVYGSTTITNAVFKIDTKEDALVYNLVVDDIQNSQFQLPSTSITGKVQNNTVYYTLQLKDVKDVERYLSGTLKHRQEIMSFVSTQISYCLIMNPGKWMQIT
jgi:hypothetical protein